MFLVMLTISCYEEKVRYERSFYISLRKNGVFSICTRAENEEHFFETIEQAEQAIKYFCGLDFSYAFINDVHNTTIKTYYIRNEMQLF